MSNSKTLQEIFETLVELNVIAPKRVGPVRTAIKQYAGILDYSDPTDCPISAYLKPDAARNRLIEEKAPQTLGTDAVRNLKSNVSLVLRKAIELGVISPLAAELASWRESNPVKLMPRRNESVYPPKYAIDPVPERLEQEIAEYETWSTKTHNRVRPTRLRKRPITFFHHRQVILREAGYLVKFKGVKRESITLLTLVDPNNAIDYVESRIDLQNRHTKGSVAVLSTIIALARYLEIIVQASEQKSIIQQWVLELRSFSATLGMPATVQHKKNKRWLSLAQLEMVGRSIYPLNARRVSELSKYSRANLKPGGNNLGRPHWTFRIYAFRVMQSLLIRLLVRIPLRQRNLRELRWAPRAVEEGQNLFRKDGVWGLRFQGKELKIAEVRGEVNSLEYEFPDDLVGLLEEWINKWRPMLIAAQKSEDKGKERLEDGQEFVFLNSWGRPLTLGQITHAFEMATFKFTGVSVNPHTIRSIWPTEYIKATHNLVDAAYMLGDSVEVVLRIYARLLDEECGKRAGDWIGRRLSGESTDTNKSRSEPNDGPRWQQRSLI
jgi:hypothetical protein